MDDLSNPAVSGMSPNFSLPPNMKDPRKMMADNRDPAVRGLSFNFSYPPNMEFPKYDPKAPTAAIVPLTSGSFSYPPNMEDPRDRYAYEQQMMMRIAFEQRLAYEKFLETQGREASSNNMPSYGGFLPTPQIPVPYWYPHGYAPNPELCPPNQEDIPETRDDVPKDETVEVGKDTPEDGKHFTGDGNDTKEDGNNTTEDGNDIMVDRNDTTEDGNDNVPQNESEDEYGGKKSQSRSSNLLRRMRNLMKKEKKMEDEKRSPMKADEAKKGKEVTEGNEGKEDVMKGDGLKRDADGDSAKIRAVAIRDPTERNATVGNDGKISYSGNTDMKDIIADGIFHALSEASDTVAQTLSSVSGEFFTTRAKSTKKMSTKNLYKSTDKENSPSEKMEKTTDDFVKNTAGNMDLGKSAGANVDAGFSDDIEEKYDNVELTMSENMDMEGGNMVEVHKANYEVEKAKSKIVARIEEEMRAEEAQITREELSEPDGKKEEQELADTNEEKLAKTNVLSLRTEESVKQRQGIPTEITPSQVAVSDGNKKSFDMNDKFSFDTNCTRCGDEMDYAKTEAVNFVSNILNVATDRIRTSASPYVDATTACIKKNTDPVFKMYENISKQLEIPPTETRDVAMTPRQRSVDRLRREMQLVK